MGGHRVDNAGAGPQVGERAPEFALRRSFTQDVRLADELQRGPVVLAFYVFDFGGL